MSDLMKYYNDLKAINGGEPIPAVTPTTKPVASTSSSTQIMIPPVIKRKINDNGCDLEHRCHKKILLDIYCQILPLDDNYKSGNMGTMNKDVDNMLNKHSMNATQYLKSSYDKNNAPLLEFIIRSADALKKQFIEESENTVRDKITKGLTPSAPDIDDGELDNQITDIKDDNEYKAFIDKLKEKTANKIINDVSSVIIDKKQQDDMSFKLNKPAEESTIAIGMNCINKKLMKENVDLDSNAQEEFIGMAIREAVINELQLIFKQTPDNSRLFESALSLNKGIVITESAINEIINSNK